MNVFFVLFLTGKNLGLVNAKYINRLKRIMFELQNNNIVQVTGS